MPGAATTAHAQSEPATSVYGEPTDDQPMSSAVWATITSLLYDVTTDGVAWLVPLPGVAAAAAASVPVPDGTPEYSETVR